jgi:hypothetical protein
MWRRVFVGCLLAASLGCLSWDVEASAAEPDLGDLKLIRILPRNADEIAHAHERAKASSCETVPSGEPLEITSFTPQLTQRDRTELARGVILLPSSRRHMLTVGLEVRESDKPRLPKVSRGRILQYLQDHYVTLQARIQKDPITGKLFLHHRPLAATTSFGRGRLTESFTEPTLLAVQDFHSLGIFLPSNQTPKPENLRTLVMIYKSFTVGATTGTGKIPLKPVYEWVFVRGVEPVDQDARHLVLHVFCTSGERRRMHRLVAWESPKNPRDCGIFASVVFTEYTTLGLIPSKSATREVDYKSEMVFEWSDLDAFASEQGWTGDALDNLQPTLDAIIDGKLSK